MAQAAALDREVQEKGHVEKSFVSIMIFLDVGLNILHYILSARSAYTYFTSGYPMFGLVLTGIVLFGYKRQADVGGIMDLV